MQQRQESTEYNNKIVKLCEFLKKQSSESFTSVVSEGEFCLIYMRNLQVSGAGEIVLRVCSNSSNSSSFSRQSYATIAENSFLVLSIDGTYIRHINKNHLHDLYRIFMQKVIDYTKSTEERFINQYLKKNGITE